MTGRRVRWGHLKASRTILCLCSCLSAPAPGHRVTTVANDVCKMVSANLFLTGATTRTLRMPGFGKLSRKVV